MPPLHARSPRRCNAGTGCPEHAAQVQPGPWPPWPAMTAVDRRGRPSRVPGGRHTRCRSWPSCIAGRTAHIALGRVQRLPGRVPQVALAGIVPVPLPLLDRSSNSGTCCFLSKRQFAQVLAAVAVGRGQFGIQLDRLVEVLLGGDQVVLLLLGQAAAVVGVRVLGIQLDGLGEILDRAVEVLAVRPGHAAVDVQLGVGRVGLDGLA